LNHALIGNKADEMMLTTNVKTEQQKNQTDTKYQVDR
jgi:hypothetical protein